MQKFKRGNLVRVLQGHLMWSIGGNKETTMIDLSPEDVGREAIIEYSYNEKYGGNRPDVDKNSYSIVWKDTGGSLAWKEDNELELIDEGGEHLLEEAKRVRDTIVNRDKDLKYILSKLEEGNLSSTSILYLFDLLGFKSNFLNNGEFFVLTSDWYNLHPVFVHIYLSNNLEEAMSILKEGNTLNVENVFNRFKEVK